MWRLILGCVAAAALGCESSPPRETVDRPAVVGGEAVVAVAGSVAVVPAIGLLPGEVSVTLNGQPVPATAHRVIVEPQTSGLSDWRAPAPVWREAPAPDGGPVVVRITVPPAAEDGVVRIGATERPLDVVPRGTPTVEPAPLARRDLYAAESVGAGDAWRLELAGIGLGVLAGRHPAERAAAIALAEKWKAGIVRLESVDRWLAQRLMLALTRTAEASGVRAPAWSLDADADARLLDDLLDQTLSATQVADRARAWLAAQDELVARVRDPASAGVIAAQVTDLAGRTARAQLSDGRDAGAAALLTPYRSVLLPAPGSAPEADRPFLIASAGRRSVEIPRPLASITATPPGARLGPLTLDLTMADWLGGSARPLPSDLAAGALLQRRASASAWELYIEAKATEGAERDTLTVWLGPRSVTAAGARIDAAGAIQPIPGAPAMELLAHDVSEDRWSALLAIPAEAIAPDGTLLIGLTRELTVRGERLRASWPVALLPWEAEPGRVEIDLTEWMGL